MRRFWPRQELDDAGFTLVELLAALALPSLVSLILLGSLRLGQRAWQRGAEQEHRIDQVALAQNLLRRAIEDAYPFFAADASTGGRVELEGTTHTLRWLSSAAQALGKAGRARWSLAVADGAKGANLEIIALAELATDAGQAAQKILLANIKSIELSYYGKPRSAREPGWQPQWSGEAQPPDLVRIRVSFPPGDPRTWPELIIAPRIGADVGCVYDPLSKQCRGR